MTDAAANKAAGAHFEAMFIARCGAYGIKALRNELSHRYMKGGKAVAIRADLDFRCLRRDGRIAYIDNKSFAADHFTFAQLSKHQVLRAMQYDSYNVPAGFVVHFRPSNQVVYIKGSTVYTKGARARFTAEDGKLLGNAYAFDPRLIFAAHHV